MKDTSVTNPRNEHDKDIATQSHQPPKFVRCSEWPMCMCNQKCQPSVAQPQYQLGLA